MVDSVLRESPTILNDGGALLQGWGRRRYGWTCRLESTERNGKVYHYWRSYKRIGGRVRSIYIGRDWNRVTPIWFRKKRPKGRGES
jgi:hypothetical protein